MRSTPLLYRLLDAVRYFELSGMKLLQLTRVGSVLPYYLRHRLIVQLAGNAHKFNRTPTGLLCVVSPTTIDLGYRYA